MYKILFVDDNKDICFINQTALQMQGFTTTVKHSGNEAIKALEDDQFDLLITDLYMDQGGGQQLIEWCQIHKPKLKILAISGEGLDQILSALDLVSDRGIPTLEKPYELSQLGDIVRGILENQFY